jgi:Tol biopolymer transport system component
VFGIHEGSVYPTYEVNLQDGASRKICADCGSLSDLSPDSEHLLYHAGEPWSAYSLNLRTGQKTLILSHRGRIYASSFSPDGKWLAFHVDSGDDEMPRRIYVTPFVPDQRIPETQWISITDGAPSEFDASWSADGAMIFFVSDRDGNRCIWGRRVNPQNKRPIGEVFAVTHLHQMNAHIPDSVGVSISAASGRLVFGAVDLSSTLYRAERSR